MARTGRPNTEVTLTDTEWTTLERRARRAKSSQVPAMRSMIVPVCADGRDDKEIDIRNLTLEDPAALIYCPFRSLQHLPTWADRRRTFEHVAASLCPGGRFAWNAIAFDHHIAARLDGERRPAPVPNTTHFAIGDNRIDIVLNDGSTSSSWWATKNEWLGLIDVAGLELEALYGGFAHEPFTEDSREYVFVARRPLC